MCVYIHIQWVLSSPSGLELLCVRACPDSFSSTGRPVMISTSQYSPLVTVASSVMGQLEGTKREVAPSSSGEFSLCPLYNRNACMYNVYTCTCIHAVFAQVMYTDTLMLYLVKTNSALAYTRMGWEMECCAFPRPVFEEGSSALERRWMGGDGAGSPNFFTLTPPFLGG